MYLAVIVIYCVLMTALALIKRVKKIDLLELNLASRNLTLWQSSFSISASWIWAPALFVAAERAYTHGLLGWGWFSLGNILTLMIFGRIAVKGLRKLKGEHTIAELLGNIYSSKRLKNIYDVELLLLAVCATAVQLLAGGLVVSYLTGLDFTLVTALMVVSALSYSFVSGLRASVRTDFVQMAFILIAVAVTVVFLLKTGVTLSLGGIDSLSINPFGSQNLAFFLAFGFTIVVAHLTGPISDQSFWQRAFAMKESYIVKSFKRAAVVFMFILLGISALGFAAAGAGFVPENRDIVGLEFLVASAPVWIVVIFLLCLIAGLASTLDSQMCAVGSIISRFSEKTKTTKYARLGMIGISLAGMAVANVPGLGMFWFTLLFGVLRMTVTFPTLMTVLRKKKIQEPYLFWGIFVSMVIGVPAYGAGSVLGFRTLTLAGMLFTLLFPLLIILLGIKKEKNESKKT